MELWLWTDHQETCVLMGEVQQLVQEAEADRMLAAIWQLEQDGAKEGR